MVGRAYLGAGLLGLCLASSVFVYGYVVSPLRILARTLSQDAERSLAPTLIELVQSPQIAPQIVFVFGWFAGVAMVAFGWRAGAVAASAAKSPEQET